MTIDDPIAALNITAMVLGYFVLALFVLFVSWLVGVWLDKWQYKKRRDRQHDIEWDNIRSKWLDNYVPIERRPTNHHTTDVLDFTPEDIINYSKGPYRAAS
jgi:hypothetical protein